MLKLTWLLFNLFLGSLIVHLTQIFEPRASKGYAYGLLILAPVLTILFLQPSFRSFSRRLFPTLILPLALTFFLLRSELSVWSVFHPSHRDLLTLLAYYLPFQGISLLALTMFLYIERWNSVLLFLILATLLEMLVFSYVKRTWSLAFPVYLASGILLQFVLRQKHHLPKPLSELQKNELTLGVSARRPRTTATRVVWVVILVSLTLTLGLKLPIMAPVWFQQPVTLNGVLGGTGKGPIPLDRDTLFAWKTSDLGGPWQGDYTALFYVQGPEPVYWRSETFDYYDPRGWWSRTSSPTLMNISPPILLGSNAETQTYQVRLLQPLAQGTGILVPGQLAEFSKISITGASFSYNQYANTLWSNWLLPAKTEYTVEVTLPKYSADDLRKALPFRQGGPQGGYSSPNNFSVGRWNTRDPRLVRLAEQVTQGIQNPYDKIQALSNYLKNKMTYNLNPPAPPDGDFVSDFLFNTHQGYCIHFASALVLMSRALGFSSRLAMGFTYGERLHTTRTPFPGKNISTVRVLTKNDAHSWAEIYFQGYGWVPFEATPGFSNPQEPYEQTALAQVDLTADNSVPDNPAKKENSDRPDPSADAGESTSLPFYLKAILSGLGLVLFFLTLFFSIRRYLRQRRWQKMNGHERLAFLYQELLTQAQKSGLSISPSATPAELLRLPLGAGQGNRLWTDAMMLVEKGLYAPGSGEREAAALLVLKPQLLRLLGKYKKEQKA